MILTKLSSSGADATNTTPKSEAYTSYNNDLFKAQPSGDNNSLPTYTSAHVAFRLTNGRSLRYLFFSLRQEDMSEAEEYLHHRSYSYVYSFCIKRGRHASSMLVTRTAADLVDPA